MPPLSQAPLSSLRAWHEQQQPFVRALAGPMVEDMSAALVQMQSALDERDAQLASIEAYEARVAELGERVQVMEREAHSAQVALETSLATIDELVAKLKVTTDRINVLERHKYGRRSEKRRTPDAKTAARRKRRNELTDEEKKARRQAAEARRQAQLDALRTVTHTVSLPECFAQAQGREFPPLTSVVYEWRPGELVRVEVVREQRALAEGAIVTAPPVEQVIEGGSYGPALYAKICVDKCLFAMPLRRQERAFRSLGVPLPASTLCALFHRAGDLLTPLYEALHAHGASSPHVQADETPLPVLDENATRKGWMWVFATDDVLLFRYSPSRGKAVPKHVLGGTSGTLTTDAYAAYDCISGELGRKRGGCWSHARRGLYDACQHDEPFVQPLLAAIGELFYVEELAQEQGIVGTPAHLALREERSRPVIEHIFAELDDYDARAVDGRSSLRKAVCYVLEQREPLQLFLTDAAVPIHNNLSERALRVIALLRKNSLFAGDDDAAQRFAQLLSLLATCQLHDVDPAKWLADVLIAINEPGLLAQDLLPWNWKITRGPSFRPYYDTA